MGRYDDIQQIINQDFNNFLSENSFVKMTISGVVSKILDDFFVNDRI